MYSGINRFKYSGVEQNKRIRYFIPDICKSQSLLHPFEWCDPFRSHHFFCNDVFINFKDVFNKYIVYVHIH